MSLCNYTYSCISLVENVHFLCIARFRFDGGRKTNCQTHTCYYRCKIFVAFSLFCVYIDLWYCSGGDVAIGYRLEVIAEWAM